MLNKPFADRKQIEEYVESELRQAMPSGWRAIRQVPGVMQHRCRTSLMALMR